MSVIFKTLFLIVLAEHGSALVPLARPEGSSSYSSTTSRLYVDGQGMAGGTRHLLGDIIRSLQPEYLKQVADAVQSNVQGMAEVDVDDFCRTLESQGAIDSWQQLANKFF